ncbi:MAG: hypothetical protein IJ111_12900 [Eggerthellaceae bacterium]|nr:hypothetical protein [Eggerthellaceae bacterium]
MENSNRTMNVPQNNNDLYELDPSFGQTMVMPESESSVGDIAKSAISAEDTAPMAPIDPSMGIDEQTMYDYLEYGQEKPARKSKLPVVIGIIVVVAALAVAAVVFLVPMLTSGNGSSQAAVASSSTAASSSSAAAASGESSASAASSAAAASASASAAAPEETNADAQAAPAQTGDANNYSWQGNTSQNDYYYDEPSYDTGGGNAEPAQDDYVPDTGGGDAGGDAGGEDAGGATGGEGSGDDISDENDSI